MQKSITIWDFRRTVSQRKHLLDTYCCPLGIGSEPLYRGSPWADNRCLLIQRGLPMDYAQGLAQGYDVITEGSQYGKYPRFPQDMTDGYARGLRYGRRIGALVKAQRNIHG